MVATVTFSGKQHCSRLEGVQLGSHKASPAIIGLTVANEYCTRLCAMPCKFRPSHAEGRAALYSCLPTSQLVSARAAPYQAISWSCAASRLYPDAVDLRLQSHLWLLLAVMGMLSKCEKLCMTHL